MAQMHHRYLNNEHPSHDLQLTFIIAAPLCSPPPDVPFEGFLNISSPVHDVQNVDTCETDGEELEIVCPSFLNVYIRSATYGRKAHVNTVCTGEKDKGPAEDCLDTEVLKKAKSECHGKYTCTIGVSGSLADLSLTCNTNKKELNITHTCGKHNYLHSPCSNTVLYHAVLVSCYRWQSYLFSPGDCVAKALVQNQWLQQEQVQNMGEMDLKSALIENLNKHLDEEIHSVPELSYRKEMLCAFLNRNSQ